MFLRLARHLPGLGGPSALDEFTLPEVQDLLNKLRAELEAEAAAMRSARK